MPKTDLDDLLPLTPAAYLILLALAGGESHGYSVMQEVSAMTHGKTTLGPGTLYRSIQKLLLDKLIEEVGGSGSDTDERRRVYRLTARGRQIAKAEARRLSTLVAVAVARKLIPDRSRPSSKEIKCQKL